MKTRPNYSKYIDEEINNNSDAGFWRLQILKKLFQDLITLKIQLFYAGTKLDSRNIVSNGGRV
jgi:hypothetical protein